MSTHIFYLKKKNTSQYYAIIRCTVHAICVPEYSKKTFFVLPLPPRIWIIIIFNFVSTAIVLVIINIHDDVYDAEIHGACAAEECVILYDIIITIIDRWIFLLFLHIAVQRTYIVVISTWNTIRYILQLIHIYMMYMYSRPSPRPHNI